MSSSNIIVNKLNTMSGHKDCVYALCEDLAQHCFYSCGADGQLIRWNLKDQNKAKLVAKIPSSVYSLALIASKSTLVLGQNFDGIHLIDTASNQQTGSLKLGKTAIFDIKTYLDFLIIALGSGEVVVVDHNTLNIVKKIKVTEKSARCIAINPVERQFVVGYSDHSMRVYSLTDFSLVKQIDGHTNSVFTVKYSPDFEYLLSAGRDALLKVWDISAGYAEKISIPAHMYTINHIEFHPSGEKFVTCSMDKSIKVWDTTTFELLKVIDKARHAGHGTSVNKLYWTSFNNWLISCSDDRTVSIWDFKFGDHI